MPATDARRSAARRALLRAALAAGLAPASIAFARTPGEPAPDFDLATTDGGRVSLAGLRGRVAYVDFWASWCAPCRRSFPWMGTLQQRHGGSGLQVVAINVDARVEDARRFLAAVPAAFTVALDAAGTTPRAYAIRAMPTSVLVGRDGTVLHVHAGFRDADVGDLETRVRAALAAPGGALPARGAARDGSAG